MSDFISRRGFLRKMTGLLGGGFVFQRAGARSVSYLNGAKDSGKSGENMNSKRKLEIGNVWNESEIYKDAVTGRAVRRLSTNGRINQTPTYHTNSGFSADGRYLVFISVRDGRTYVLRAEVESGELCAVWQAPGIGDRNYIHRSMGLTGPDIDGRGIAGNRLCIAPESHYAVFTCERSLYAVDLNTFKERTLIEDVGKEWIFGAPCVSPNEQYVTITLSSAHPDLITGKKTQRNYRSFPDHKLRVIRVPMSGSGNIEVLYGHQPAQSAHSSYCPTDDNLLYFDLDLPPGYWGGGDGKTPRIWLLDMEKRRVWPLKENYPGPFQTHQAWLWDGSAMAYHGGLSGGGVYIGIAAVDGQTIWEHEFPEAEFYGHLTPDAKRPALILDGDFSKDQLKWLYYDQQEPGLEPICCHNTEWRSIPGQYSHPHPLTDASGRWISFTSAKNGRSDVYVVETTRET